MTSPVSCEKEMTLLVLAECPRHNATGRSFRDYGDRDYHGDLYFDDFGGYDLFRFLVLRHPSSELCRVVWQLVGGDKFLTAQEEAAALGTWTSLSDEKRACYLNRAIEYWMEVYEKLHSLGVELPAKVTQQVRE